MEIVVHSKKSLFQQKVQKKLYHFSRNSQFRSVMWKMMQLDIRSRTKNPTLTPSVVRNPTPPKNLRLAVLLGISLFGCLPSPRSPPSARHCYSHSDYDVAKVFSLLHCADMAYRGQQQEVSAICNLWPVLRWWLLHNTLLLPNTREKDVLDLLLDWVSRHGWRSGGFGNFDT